MPSPNQPLLTRIYERLPRDFWQSNVLVAVSGGSDSMALVHLIRELAQQQVLFPQRPFHLLAFHFDHQWYAGSARSASWVKEQLEALGVKTTVVCRSQVAAPLHEVEEFHAPAEKVVGPQSEGDARTIRYQAFCQVAETVDARYALTGHTRDDQVETLVMRIGRGTGLPGLCGIPQRRALTSNCCLIRPLLRTTRVELQQYLSSIGQTYLEDPSNSSHQWTRNRIRHEVVPWLKLNLAANVEQSLLRLASLATDQQEVVEHLGQIYSSALIETSSMQLQIDTRPVAHLNEAIVRVLLVHWWSRTALPQREMTHERWCELTALVLRPELSVDINDRPAAWPSRLHLPGHIRASRSKGIVTIGLHR